MACLSSQSTDTEEGAQPYWIDHTENYYRTLQLAVKYDGVEHILHDYSDWTIPVYSFDVVYPKQPYDFGHAICSLTIPIPGSKNPKIIHDKDARYFSQSSLLDYLKNELMPKYGITILHYEGMIEHTEYNGIITR